MCHRRPLLRSSVIEDKRQEPPTSIKRTEEHPNKRFLVVSFQVNLSSYLVSWKQINLFGFFDGYSHHNKPKQVSSEIPFRTPTTTTYINISK